MILTLAWKEFREHRSIWLTMIVMTGLLGLAVTNLTSPSNNPATTLGITMLALAGVYGVVCGSMMFAGEREGGTLVLFDIFLGRRDLLWLCKLFIGVVLAATEGFAVAAILYFQQQAPPEWMASLVSITTRPIDVVVHIPGPARPTHDVWFWVLPIVTVEAYAWGLLASALTQRVLTSAGLALVMGFHAWMLLAFLPQPASLALRAIAMVIVLFTSFQLLSNQSRETSQGAPPVRVDPKVRVLRELYRERRMSEVIWEDDSYVPTVIPIDEPGPSARRSRRLRWDEDSSPPPTVLPAPGIGLPVVGSSPVPMTAIPGAPTQPQPVARSMPDDAPESAMPIAALSIPVTVDVPRAEAPTLTPSQDGKLQRRPRSPRPGDGPPDAASPREVLLWLTFRQAGVAMGCLGAACVVAGVILPSAGQPFWPVATLLLGIACGTATFAWEQSDLSYQFLAAQRFPLTMVWNVKTIVWALAALGGTLLLILGSTVALLLMTAAARNVGQRDPGFEFGTLLNLLGPVNYFGVWIVYGYAVGQLFVFLCRKPVYAVMISAMVSAGAVCLWLPSLLCRGMNGWQAWLVPVGLLAATRILVRTWASGRIKERKPLTGLIGVGALVVAWALVNYGYRAWSVPDVGEPVDRTSFRASLPVGGDANLAAQKIQEAIAELDAEGKAEVWRARMAELRGLPLGVIEIPSPDGQPPSSRHLPTAGKLAARLLAEATAEHDKEVFLARVAEVLTLSRNLRNKAPVTSYLAGIEMERMALKAIEDQVTRHQPSADNLQKMLAELEHHARETPPPLDCL